MGSAPSIIVTDRTRKPFNLIILGIAILMPQEIAYLDKNCYSTNSLTKLVTQVHWGHLMERCNIYEEKPSARVRQEPAPSPFVHEFKTKRPGDCYPTRLRRVCPVVLERARYDIVASILDIDCVPTTTGTTEEPPSERSTGIEVKNSSTWFKGKLSSYSPALAFVVRAFSKTSRGLEPRRAQLK